MKRPAPAHGPQPGVDMIRLFSFNIDFQRDIREGDQLRFCIRAALTGATSLPKKATFSMPR